MGHTEGGWAGTSRLDGGHLRMCAFETDVAGSGIPDECIDRPAMGGAVDVTRDRQGESRVESGWAAATQSVSFPSRDRK